MKTRDREAFRPLCLPLYALLALARAHHATAAAAGEIIKGINGEVPTPWQYKGKAPDMGIREAGEPLPHYGPRPSQCFAKMRTVP